MQPINLNTPTEALLRELFNIQQSFNRLGVKQECKETIAKISLKAFNDHIGENNVQKAKS